MFDFIQLLDNYLVAWRAFVGAAAPKSVCPFVTLLLGVLEVTLSVCSLVCSGESLSFLRWLKHELKAFLLAPRSFLVLSAVETALEI